MTTETTLFSDITTLAFNHASMDNSTSPEQAPWTTESDYDAMSLSLRFEEERYALSVPQQNAVFETFNILEILMTSLEVIIWILAAINMPRWRKKYRNQLLLQISVARFVKRLIFTFMYLQKHQELSGWYHMATILNTLQIYIDFVIVVLVFFFVKHMYDSLIIVMVQVRKHSFYKLSLYAWLLPAPMSAVWTVIILYNALTEWVVYLLICCLFRWPLILMGTAVYVTVLYRVVSDQIRRFARSLTIVTFLMCLVINVYLITKDIIWLWCIESFETILISYISELVMNALIICFYIILIVLEYKQAQSQLKLKTLQSFPDFSVHEINKI